MTGRHRTDDEMADAAEELPEEALPDLYGKRNAETIRNVITARRDIDPQIAMSLAALVRCQRDQKHHHTALWIEVEKINSRILIVGVVLLFSWAFREQLLDLMLWLVGIS